MYLENVPADQLPAMLAGFVREGICFKARPDDDSGKTYTVEFTGGH